jgi:fatty-acyl-CoA synthase
VHCRVGNGPHDVGGAALRQSGAQDAPACEVPVAFVVLATGSSLSAEQVLALFDGRIAAYKQPRDIVFLDAMPQTSVGKPDKKMLRAHAERTT